MIYCAKTSCDNRGDSKHIEFSTVQRFLMVILQVPFYLFQHGCKVYHQGQDCCYAPYSHKFKFIYS